MKSMRIQGFLQSLHTSHLRRPRPTFRVNLKAMKRKSLNRATTTTESNSILQSEIDRIQGKLLEELQQRQQSNNQYMEDDDDLALGQLTRKLYDLARELGDAEQVQQALGHYRNLHTRDMEWEARAYRRLGKTQMADHDPLGAVVSFETALQIWRDLEQQTSADDDDAKATASNIGETLYLQGMAELACNEATTSAASLDSNNVEPTNFATMRQTISHLEDARGHLLQALEIFKKCSTRRRIIDTAKAVGKIYCIQNQYDLACTFLEENSFLRDKLKAPVGDRTGHECVADMLLEMGDALCQKGEEGRAILCYQDCLHISRQHLGPGHILTDEALVALGDLYCYNGQQTDLALECFQQVFIGAEHLFEKHITLKTAILRFQDNQTMAALAEFQDTIQMCKKADKVDTNIRFTCVLSNSVCHYTNGDRQEAKDCIEEAIRIASESNLFGPNNNPQVEALLKESEAQLFRSRFGRALNSFNRKVQSGFNMSAGTFAFSKQSEHHRITWFYYLQSDSFGNPDGWYAFDSHPGNLLEARYQRLMFEHSPQLFLFTIERIGNRGFSYVINLKAMTQTNITSEKSRPIHRSESGESPVFVPTDELAKIREAEKRKFGLV